VKPAEVLPPADDGPDEVTLLEAELKGVRAELAEASAFMDANGFSPTIGKRVKDLEDRVLALGADLEAARARAATPLDHSWREAKGLRETLEDAADPTDARLRLRAVLARIVDSIQLLVVGRGRDRIAAVQIWFAGQKKHRDYLIHHRPPRWNGKRGEGKA